MLDARSSRTRGSRVLRALSLAGLSFLLPACGGCDVGFERSSTAPEAALFRGLIVGGTKPDGPFVVALRESTSEDFEATVVSLGEEPWMCSLGPATWYFTAQQSLLLGLDEESVDDRPARILTIEGEIGDTSGPLRVFDAMCEEILQAPAIFVPAAPIYGKGAKIEAYSALSVDGSLLWIDPWAPSIRTIGQNVSHYGRMNKSAFMDKTTFWLVEDGALVLRDIEGNTLVSAGSGVTEVAAAPDGTELAFVDEGGLFVMKVEDLTPAPIVTEGAPCKVKYTWLSAPTLTYREDCALGNLAILDRSTGDKWLFSSDVVDAQTLPVLDAMWVFFLREPPGGERELWAVPEGSEPVLVGVDPYPEVYMLGFGHEHGSFVILEHDSENGTGGTGTLGAWTPAGGFEPLLEGVGWFSTRNEYLPVVADREGDVGALVALELDTLVSALRVEGVHWMTVRSSPQAPVLGYIRGWDSALGAGTFEVWIQPTGQQVTVDEGVSEFRELFWPEPGAVYAVRAPGREGLWTAYPDL
jgi:hypothetical protein